MFWISSERWCVMIVCQDSFRGYFSHNLLVIYFLVFWQLQIICTHRYQKKTSLDTHIETLVAEAHVFQQPPQLLEFSSKKVHSNRCFRSVLHLSTLCCCLHQPHQLLSRVTSHKSTLRFGILGPKLPIGVPVRLYHVPLKSKTIWSKLGSSDGTTPFKQDSNRTETSIATLLRRNA